jgi:hypothetical protein
MSEQELIVQWERWLGLFHCLPARAVISRVATTKTANHVCFARDISFSGQESKEDGLNAITSRL